MNKLTLVTFAGIGSPFSKENRDFKIWKGHRDYRAEATRLIESAQKVGIQNIRLFDWEWLINTQEYKDNPKTFSTPPYFWAFKPVIIWETLNSIDYGDALIYSDSNHIFYQFPYTLINSAVQNHIYTYDHRPTIHHNYHWTRRDTFVNMKCDEIKYWNGPQYHANVICIYKDNFSIKFVREWKKCTINYDIVRGNNVHPDSPWFVEDRGDQSVFSILAIKYGLPAQRSPETIISEGVVILSR